jgi:hypothetical protein
MLDKAAFCVHRARLSGTVDGLGESKTHALVKGEMEGLKRCLAVLTERGDPAVPALSALIADVEAVLGSSV